MMGLARLGLSVGIHSEIVERQRQAAVDWLHRVHTKVGFGRGDRLRLVGERLGGLAGQPRAFLQASGQFGAVRAEALDEVREPVREPFADSRRF